MHQRARGGAAVGRLHPPARDQRGDDQRRRFHQRGEQGEVALDLDAAPGQHRRAHREGDDGDRAVVRRQRGSVGPREAQAEEREDQQRDDRAQPDRQQCIDPQRRALRARDLHPALEADRQQQVDRQGLEDGGGQAQAGAGERGDRTEGEEEGNGIDHVLFSFGDIDGHEARTRRILPHCTHGEKCFVFLSCIDKNLSIGLRNTIKGSPERTPPRGSGLARECSARSSRASPLLPPTPTARAHTLSPPPPDARPHPAMPPDRPCA